MVWLKLVICIIIIFFAGQKVAKLGDIIAEKTGIGRVWMGVIALALITSLPELFTGISAVTIVKAPDLTVGNLIGANTFNFFNLALLDVFHKHGSIFTNASPSHKVTAWFSLLLLAIVAIGIFTGTTWGSPSIGWVGWFTPVLIFAYIFSERQIYHYEQNHGKPPETPFYDETISLKKTVLQFSIASIFIVGAGIWLAMIGDEIAVTTGWGQSFVGSLLIAFTTTLPEITVSFTALRIGAADMAIANIVGSNLFNLSIIAIDDLFYTNGPLLDNVSLGNLVVAGSVAAMTLLFILGLYRKPKRYFRFTWLSASIIIVFIVGAYFNFSLS